MMQDLGPLRSLMRSRGLTSCQARHPHDSLEKQLVDLEMKLQILSRRSERLSQEQSRGDVVGVPWQLVTSCGSEMMRSRINLFQSIWDCLGAIDATHIPAIVPKCEGASYRNRKGVISQNVLAACNFDMEFTYVLSGWEGSAHDSKVLYDALTRRTNRFEVPEGKFYLADCGFANRRKFLAPFRSTKYHLQEFTGEGCDPETPHELFNHRHSSLRNVIERIFGVFKSRFLIFKSAPPFSIKTQAELVLACVGLHNFLRKHCRSDEFPVEVHVQVPVEANNAGNVEGNNARDDFDNGEEIVLTQDQERENANTWREALADVMWKDATS